MARPDGDALAADLARLAARPYAEVGVPMVILAEEVGASTPRAGGGEPALAAVLLTIAEEAGATSTARLVEVLADRHLLGIDGPCFTRLSDDGAAS